jgi:hypothetical protein
MVDGTIADCARGPADPGEQARPADCPECGNRGRTVGQITLKALLCPPALARLEPLAYLVCGARQCPIVYFSADGMSRFTKADLKIRIGHKETSDPIPICYCFGHTRESILEEIRRTGQSTAAKRIAEQIRAGRCGCEVTNPAGTCCLGEINHAVKAGKAPGASDEEVCPAPLPDPLVWSSRSRPH